MAARVPIVDTSGITDLVRTFGKLSKEMRAVTVKEVRKIGERSAERIRSSTAQPYATGKLRKSVKTSVRAGQISLYSNLPQAPVWHWGGEIQPRGTPIHIPRTEFIAKEVRAQGEHIAEELGGLLEAIAVSNKFSP